MNHRTLARLLVLASFLWIVSNVVLIVQPQATDIVIAALVPTAAPQSKSRLPSTSNPVFLPMVHCSGCVPAPLHPHLA